MSISEAQANVYLGILEMHWAGGQPRQTAQIWIIQHGFLIRRNKSTTVIAHDGSWWLPPSGMALQRRRGWFFAGQTYSTLPERQVQI